MIFSKETLKAIERNKKLSVEFGKTIQEQKHKGIRMIINLTHVQSELIKAYLEGKEIEYRSTPISPWMNACIYSCPTYQDPVIVCIMNMEDGYVRVKVPEPVVTYKFRGIDKKGYVGEFIDSSLDALKMQYGKSIVKALKITLHDGLMVDTEVISL